MTSYKTLFHFFPMRTIMKKTKSVYDRMYDNKKLFFLGFGVLYITEMRRVNNLSRTSELRIKSKQLAETWYKLFKKHSILSKKSKSIKRWRKKPRSHGQSAAAKPKFSRTRRTYQSLRPILQRNITQGALTI